MSLIDIHNLNISSIFGFRVIPINFKERKVRERGEKKDLEGEKLESEKLKSECYVREIILEERE